MRRFLLAATSLAFAGPVAAQGIPNGAIGNAAINAVVTDIADLSTMAGISCDGTTDSTAGLQAAFTAYNGKALWIPPNCIIIASTVLTPASLTVYGSGISSVLKQKAAANSNFIVAATNRGDLYLSNFTVDGNYTNQTVNASNQWAGVNFVNAGQIGDNANLVVDRMTFINGTSFNVRVVTNDTAGNITNLIVRNSTFEGGVESLANNTTNSGAIFANGVINKTIINNRFDLLRTPTVGGRAGVVAQGYVNPPTQTSTALISGNYFNHMGVSVASGTIGVIDVYSAGKSVIIANNRIDDPWGRAINIKADTTYVEVTGNIVNGLSEIAGADAGAQIVVNRAVDGLTGQSVIIANNIARDSTFDGMTINGSPDSGAPGPSLSYTVTGNQIINAGVTPFSMTYITNAVVSDNIITTSTVAGMLFQNMSGFLSAHGNIVTSTTGNCITLNTSADVRINMRHNNLDTCGGYGVDVGTIAGGKIAGNVIHTTTSAPIRITTTTTPLLVTENEIESSSAISNNGTNTSLWVARNMQSTGFSLANLTLTNASNIVTAWSTDQYVDTSGGAQQVNTINGVPDGETITISASSVANTATFKNGLGNLTLTADYASTGPTKVLTLKSRNGGLVEVSRI